MSEKRKQDISPSELPTRIPALRYNNAEIANLTIYRSPVGTRAYYSIERQCRFPAEWGETFAKDSTDRVWVFGRNDFYVFRAGPAEVRALASALGVPYKVMKEHVKLQRELETQKSKQDQVDDLKRMAEKLGFKMIRSRKP